MPGATPKPTRPRAPRVSILLVDDQPARLLTYQAVLEPLGQKLVFAKSGTEALQRLMEREYALVLIDISMPGMDGFETAAMIHEHPRFERTPIIFVTGVHDTELDRIKGYKLGAVDYVSIPVVPEILRSKVAVLVELHCQRRELEALNNSLADANRELGQSNLALQRQIAERVRAEAALKEADQRKNEFLAILAHELRNPLAALSSAAHLLGRPAQDAEVIGMAREALHRQVNHMARLLDDLLDVARITHGMVQLQMGRVSIHDVIEAAVETVRPQLELKQQQLSLDVCAETAFVVGDDVRLCQVLGNLLSNSVKYTPAAGRIALRMTVDEGRVVIAVRDNGIGISPDMLDRVFEMFSQIDRSTQGPRSGLGIGLALVKGLVALHGGTITATSPGEGLGSEFTIALPALPVSIAGRAGSADAAPLDCPAFRILVADDNVDSANSWSVLLKQKGHEVRTAYGGLTALAGGRAVHAAGRHPRHRHAASRRLRTGEADSRHLLGRPCPVDRHHRLGQAHDRQLSREAGFDHHFTKPVDPAKIEQALQKGPRLPAPVTL